MADIKRLIGTDGSLVKVVLGSLQTSATPIPAKTWVQVAGKATETLIGATISGTAGAALVTASAAVTLTAGQTIHYTIGYKTYSLTVQAVSAATTINLAAGITVPDTIPAGTVVYQASKFAAVSVGEFFYNPSASTLALNAGDTYYPCTLVPIMDLAGWSLDLQADETETTVLADTIKKYRQGRSDASGTLDMVFMKGETDMPNTATQFGPANSFFASVDIANTGVASVITPRNTSATYVLGYLDQDASTNTSAGYAGPLVTLFQVQLMSFALSFKKSDVVMVSPKFRLSGATNPALYRIIA